MELKREQVATQGVVFGLSALIQYNITWTCPKGLNHFNPNCDQSQISTQFPKEKKEKQKNTVYHDKLIAEKVSIELSHRRISSADSKVDCRTILQVSIIHSRIGMKGTLGGVYMRKHAPARLSYWEINDWVISYLRWGFQSSISTPIMSNFGSKTI